MDVQDLEYKKGFNHGYRLKEGERQLFFDTLVKGLQGDSPYKDGLVDGGKQFELDRMRRQMQERMQEQRRGKGRGQ